MSTRTPAIVLGGTGYVAGELLRLIAGHPRLELAAVLSDSHAGGAVAAAFTHLQSAYPQTRFANPEEIEARLRCGGTFALFCAAPHGAAATLIDRMLKVAQDAGAHVRCVDISADYRYASAEGYAAVYGHAHGAPARIADFTCALPEHLRTAPPTPHVAHPGCFATATLLAIVPLLASGLTDARLFASGVTGSTGSGASPSTGRITRAATAICTPTTRSPTATRRKSPRARRRRPASTRNCISCRIPGRSPAASTSPCRRGSRAP